MVKSLPGDDAPPAEEPTREAAGDDAAAGSIISSPDRKARKNKPVKKSPAKKRKKTTAKKTTAKKTTAKKTTAKKTTAKKTTAKKTTAKKTTAKKTTAKKTTAKKSRARAQKSTAKKAPHRTAAKLPKVAPLLKDGATARRASRATASLTDPPAPAKAAEVGGPGLNGEAEESRPTGTITSEIHRIEQHVSRRLKSKGAQSMAKKGSLLDGVGKMLNVDTYRQWISSTMMQSRSDVVDDFGLDPVFSERWRPVLDFLYQSYWRVETTGQENLPDLGRALVVANHSGTLPYDGAMIMHAVRFEHPAHRNIRPLVEDFVFHFPFIGVALNRIGCVRACQDNAERLLDNGQVVAVFPEGIKGIGKLYRNRYQLQRFGRGGFVKLALKTRSPIIPAAIVGAEEIHPMMTKITWLAAKLGIPYIPITPTFPWLGALGTIPLPSKWTIRFGEPIDLSNQYGPDAYQDRILVNRLTEQVRSMIQSMIDESLTTRRSILFG